MFNATVNNISVISWWSVLLVEETGVPGEILSQVTEKLYHIMYRTHLAWAGFELTTLVVIAIVMIWYHEHLPHIFSFSVWYSMTNMNWITWDEIQREENWTKQGKNVYLSRICSSFRNVAIYKKTQKQHVYRISVLFKFWNGLIFKLFL